MANITLTIHLTPDASDEDIDDICEEVAGALGDMLEGHYDIARVIADWHFDDATNNIRDRLADEEEAEEENEDDNADA